MGDPLCADDLDLLEQAIDEGLHLGLRDEALVDELAGAGAGLRTGQVDEAGTGVDESAEVGALGHGSSVGARGLICDTTVGAVRTGRSSTRTTYRGVPGEWDEPTPAP